MAEYQLTATDQAVIRTADSAWIPNDTANADWREYQAWLDAGGVPDPYVPPPKPEPQPDALVEAQRANTRLDGGVDAAVEAAENVLRDTRAGPKQPVPHFEWADTIPPDVQEALDNLQYQINDLRAQIVRTQESFVAMLEAHDEMEPTR